MRHRPRRFEYSRRHHSGRGPGGRSRRRGTVEITLWHGENGLRGELLERLVAEFDDGDSTVSVVVEEQAGGRPGVMEQWRASEPADRPTLAVFPREMTRRLADSRTTVAPGSCLEEAVPDLLDVITASWTVDGTVQAVPFGVSTPVLFYNRAAFTEAGLDPDDPPATLAELRSASEQLVASGTVETGLLLNTAPSAGGGWVVEQWNAQVAAASLAPANGRVAIPAEVRAAWQDGPAVDHVGWLREMVEDGLVVSVGRNARGPDQFTQLMGDDATGAMTLYTSTALAESDPVLGDLLGVGPLPGPGEGPLPGGVAMWLADGKPDSETRAAWRLSVFLASPAAHARLVTEAGYTPISRSAAAQEPVASRWRERPQLETPYAALSAQGTGDLDLGMSVGPHEEINVLLADAVDRVLAHGADPADALADASDDANALLDAYWSGAVTGNG